MTISTNKADLLGGTAFIRPTALERSHGRLMRSPEGHDAGAPAPSPSPSPSPTPAPTATETDATALGGDGASDTDAADDDDSTALGGKGEQQEQQKVEKTPEEIAADEEAAKAAAVPETYELTAPEGVTLDAAAVELATPVFKELGLSNDQANKLMPVAAQFAQRIQDQANQQILADAKATRKEWLDSAKADPEIGGEKWADTLATGAKALDLLGFPKGSPFRTLLDDSGLGNHPEMIRVFAKVGNAIGDDPQFVRTNAAHQPKRDRAETLYPEDKPKGG